MHHLRIMFSTKILTYFTFNATEELLHETISTSFVFAIVDYRFPALTVESLTAKLLFHDWL